MNVCDQYVGCHSCKHQQTVHDALDACYVSWPQKSWAAFRCPQCKGVNHLEVRSGVLVDGHLDGFPEPALVAKRRLQLDDFHVQVDKSGIEIRSLNLRWKIPAKSVGG